MQPDHLRKTIRRWAAPVAVLVLLGAAVAFQVSRSLAPVYEARGSVLVVAGPQQSQGNPIALNASQVTSTAAALMTQPPLLKRVADELKLGESAEVLAKRVTAVPERETELVDVTVNDTDAQRAASIANAVMTDYVSQVTQANEQRVAQAGAALQGQITDLSNTLSGEYAELATDQAYRRDSTSVRAQIQANAALLSQLTINFSSFRAAQAQNMEAVSVAAAAPVPSSPTSPRIPLNTALGGVAGLVLGVALAALLTYLDQGVHTEEDVRERLDLPCIGVIPRFQANAKRRSRRAARSADAAGEAYRRLRTNLLFSAVDGPLQSVAVTSVHASEGKTRTAANLAVALAGSDNRVVLVDADMRRPSQHRLFNKPLRDGTSELLLQAARGGPIPQLNGEHETHYANLSLLTSGTVPPNPSELLASRQASNFIKALEGRYDYVVIDTPPTHAVTDALSVAAHATATVVVVEAGRASVSEIREAVNSLQRVGAHVVGVVLNKARRRDISAYYYYSSYGQPSSGPAGGQAPNTEQWMVPVNGREAEPSARIS